jgi:flagellin
VSAIQSAWSGSTTLGIVRHLARARYGQSRGIDKLSSGKRVIRASDGAADLALSVGLHTRVRSTNVARKNASNARQVMQIADGGIAEIQVMLIRLKELAMAAATETFSDQERSLMQLEVNQLVDAIDQTAWTTTYNGNVLLAQTHVDVAFVVDISGSMGDDLATLQSEINDFRQAFLDAGVDVEFGLAAFLRAIDPVDGVQIRNDIGDPGFEAALAALALSGSPVDPYSALVNVSGANDFNGDNDVFSWRPNTGHHIILLTDTGQESHLIPGDPPQSEIATQLSAAGMTVHAIAPQAQFGTFSEITTLTGGGLYRVGGGGTGIPDAMDGIASDLVGGGDIDAAEQLTVQVGLNNTDDDRIDLLVPTDATAVGLGIGALSVATSEAARAAIDDLDGAITEASTVRATIGAVQRRLDHTISYHDVSIVNETAALSRIQDLDYASAMGEYLLNETLASAATQMLSHSNEARRDHVAGIYRGMGGGGGGGRLDDRL